MDTLNKHEIRLKLGLCFYYQRTPCSEVVSYSIMLFRVNIELRVLLYLVLLLYYKAGVNDLEVSAA